MEFKVLRTPQLSESEKQELMQLFEDVFGKTKAKDIFDRQFTKNPLGYAYHGLMINEKNELAGAYTCIPSRYEISGTPVVFGLSVDTMIKPNARGNLSNLKRLAESVYEQLIADGIPMVFGLPNEKIYAVRKRILRWKDIGTLDYYILPLRPDRQEKLLLPLRPIFLLLAYMLNSLTKSTSKSFSQEKEYLIKKIDGEDFQQYRYGPEHITINSEEMEVAHFTITNFGKTKVALILDVKPLQNSSIQNAVTKICKEYNHTIDAVVYIGKLEKTPLNLFKLPNRYAPKTIRMAGRTLIPEKIPELTFHIESWRVNLSDFDIG